MIIDGLQLTNTSTINATSNQLPQITITDTFVVGSEAAMLALVCETGDICVRTDINKTFILKGANAATLSHWQEITVTSPYDIATSIFGKPANSEVVIRFRAPRAFLVSQVQTNGQAKAGTAATASRTFVLAKNGTQFGTVVFGAGQTTGTISVGSPVSFAVGDLLTLTAPATADATLADIDFSIIATI